MTDSNTTCPGCGARLASESPLGELCPRCLVELALQAAESNQDSPARAVGAYRLIEQIGEGGMGIVWRAWQEHPIRREVAVKIVKLGVNSAQVLTRFESERQALAMLSHPNVATVFDAGLTEDGRPYFAMEYVPGAPINVFADLHELPIDARLMLFLQVCEAVEHAHQKGLLHRDLKPANILVSGRDGRPLVKVIDFGVAKALSDRLSAETLHTQVGSIVGTPEYMSPEQAGATSAPVDTRTDIYSLGLVLYELLVGALPFDAGDLRRRALLEMLRVIREDEPPRLASRLKSRAEAEIREVARRRVTEPRALARRLRGDLEWITSRALEKEPSRRYASASELGADVRRHLASEPVAAGPPDLGYRLGKLIRRHRASAVGAGIAVAALIAGVTVSSVMWIRAERARAETRGQLAASLVAGGTARLDAWDWSGALLSFVKALEIDPDRSRERDHRLRIGQVLDRLPRLVRLWPHGLRVTSIDVSARNIIASSGTDGLVRLWSLETGQEVAPPLKHTDAVNRVRFSPDGARVASASRDGTAHVWSADDGTPIGPPLRHDREVVDVAFSPDSQTVATAGADGWVKVWRVGAGAPTVTIDLGAPLLRIVFTKDGTRLAAASVGLDGHGFGVRLWSVAEGTAAGEWIRGEARWALADMDLSPDGAYIVTSGTHGCYCARLWNATTGKPVGDALSHRNAVAAGRFNAAGTLVVTAGFDRVVQVWSVPAAKPVSPPWTSIGWPESVGFTADGQLVVSTVSGAVEIFAPSGSPTREHSRLVPTLSHAGPVSSATFDASGRFVVTSSADGAVRVWDLSPTMPSEPPFAWYASGWVSNIELFDRGRRVAASARIFDMASGLPVVPPLRTEPEDLHLALSRDGQRVATGGFRIARVWDTATGEPVSPVLKHTGDLNVEPALIFSADASKLLTLSNRDGAGTATMWDAQTGVQLLTLKHDTEVTAGAFSGDGTLVMTGSAERAINLRVWRTDTGALTFTGQHPEGVKRAIFDRNGRIITVGPDQRVLAWAIGETGPGREVYELQSEPTSLAIGSGGTLVAGGRGGDVHAVRLRADAATTTTVNQIGAVMATDLTADEAWIVAGGDDGRANLWHAHSGERLSPAYRAGGPVYGVRFSPDGTSFAMGGAGVYVQQLRPDARSTVQLADLAELSSARRLLEGSDRVLRLGELTARWNRVNPGGPQALPPASPAWLRRQAARSLALGKVALAIEQLMSVRATGRLPWTDTMTLLAAMARAGRWSEAGAELRAMNTAREGAPELAFVETVARLRAGDRTAAQTVCRDLLTRHGTTRNPDRALWTLRTCLLDREAATQPGWSAVASLLDALVDQRTYGTRDSLAGAIAVRSRRHAEAIAMLQRAAQAGEATPHTALFLGLALAQSNRRAEAQRWLVESERFSWPPTTMFSQRTFREAWFEGEAVILREELRAILR